MSRRGASCDVVVAGSGIAGVLATAAALRSGAEVTVVEQLREPGRVAGQQLHNLVTRGQVACEEVLPGLLQALRRAGAVRGSVSAQTHVFELGVVMPRRELGLELWSLPKPLLVRTARSLVAAAGPVDWRQGRIVGLLGDAERVHGVRLADGSELAADVVVDALGSSSPVAGLLERLGAAPVDVDIFDPQQWYVTSTWRAGSGVAAEAPFMLVFATDSHPGTALVSPAGHDLWRVSVSGPVGHAPPRDPDGVRAHVAALPDPVVHRLLEHCVPVGGLDTYTKRSAGWRRYDRGPTPSGVISVGDAAFAPNPIYGQGLSLAAWGASRLGPLLAGPGRSADWASAREDVAHVCRAGWELMTVMSPLSRLSLDGSGWRSVATRVVRDAEAHRHYVEMWHLMRPIDVAAELARPEPSEEVLWTSVPPNG